MTNTFLAPTQEMESISRQLQASMVESIQQAGGWMPFDQWMSQALYTPGLGYYSNLHGLGLSGDFITAPEISPLFSRVIAKQIMSVLSDMESPEILEFGAGSGAMAAEIMAVGMLNGPKKPCRSGLQERLR